MARNAEKANTMLNKWQALRSQDTAASLGLAHGREQRRPYLASECRALPEAERWRGEVVRDVARKMSEVQNAGLGEARLRDLNDEINKLLREKGHWERQIKALGGPDHARAAAATAGEAGAAAGWELPGARGYKYFGAARELPGVKELFADAAAAASGGGAGAGGEGADFAGFGARRRNDVLRGLTPDYFGFRDEDDGVLLPLEARRSAELRAQAHAAWEAAGGEEGARARLKAEGGGAGAAAAAAGAGGEGAAASAAAPAVPALTAAAASEMIAARRRALLAATYGEGGGAPVAPAAAATAAPAAAATMRLVDDDE